jgi:hypothetical protein
LLRSNPEELPMPGVRDAAVALIGVAPESTVLTVLRMLVDAVTPAPAPTVPRPVPSSRAKPAATAQPAAVDPAWEALRQQVRAAMAERGANYADVAEAIGRSDIGVRISLGCRRPPKSIVRTRLQQWLDQALEVATPAATFPGSSAERRGNGHDAGGPYSSTAAA